MKTFILTTKSTFLAAVLIATTSVFALPTLEVRDTEGPSIPEGYKMGELRITGEINGVAVNHTGTVQEVLSQLDAEDNSFNLADYTAGIQKRDLNYEQIDKRYPTDLYCLPVNGQTWTGAQSPAITDGIAFLRQLNFCRIPARACVKVSCSWDAAIYVCSDRDDEIRPACRIIANFASTLRDKCVKRNGFFKHDTVGGQYFDSGKWNVIVRKDRC